MSNKYRNFVYYACPLDRNVLAVCIKEIDNNRIRTYIGSVPGKNHQEEYMAVIDGGSRLPKRIAETIFPAKYALYEEGI